MRKAPRVSYYIKLNQCIEYLRVEISLKGIAMSGDKIHSIRIIMRTKKIIEEEINLVVCEGCICVSLNNNDSKYYAEHIKRVRELTVKKHKI